MIVPHRRGQPPGEPAALRRPVGGDRGPQQALQAAPVGALPEPLGLGTQWEPAGVEGHVHRVADAEPLGDLRELHEQPEPPPGEGLDAPLFEVCAVDVPAASELPEDRLQRQEAILGLGIRTAGDIRPAVGDRLPQPSSTRGSTAAWFSIARPGAMNVMGTAVASGSASTPAGIEGSSRQRSRR